MKHLFILNPVAGGNRKKLADNEAYIRRVMDGLGAEYELYVTKAPMDACDKIRREAEAGEALRVYACGGDGTLNECVNGAVGLNRVEVTHYPSGTGNDFIKTFGGSAARFRDLEALAAGQARPIDVIDCGGRYCVNICSVGVDARIATDVHKFGHIGPLGYVVSLAVNLAKGVNRRFSVTIGGETWERDFALICACNGQYYGGGFNPVPDAVPDDGVLNVLLVKDVSRLRFLQLVVRYAKGRYRELGDFITPVETGSLEIRSEEEFVVNVDGEAMFGRELRLRVIPRGVNFVFPAGAALPPDEK